MSELTAEECYNNLKDFVCEETKAFTKQGENGVEVDMGSIFDFAEVYYEERTKANEATTKDSNLPIHSVSVSLQEAMGTIDTYLNAGGKEQRAEAHKKGRDLYERYYKTKYMNSNER